jgi:hypothetical protein
LIVAVDTAVIIGSVYEIIVIRLVFREVGGLIENMRFFGNVNWSWNVLGML